MLESKKANDDSTAEDLSDDKLLQEYVQKKERERRVTVVGGVATFEKINEAAKGPTQDEIREQKRRKSLASEACVTGRKNTRVHEEK